VARGGSQVIPRPANARMGDENPWHGRVDRSRFTIERVTAVLARHGGRDQPDDLPTTPMRPPFVAALRDAAVLVPLFEGDTGELRVFLTRRSGRMNNHRGEVAFPGGRLDAGETPLEAALREAEEEVALPRASVRIVGSLEPLTTVVSSSRITPFVGIIDDMARHRSALTPSPREVDRIFDVALEELIHPDCYREEVWDFADGTFPVWFFEVEDDTIWGATGRMLRRLLDLTLLD
jgi:8-oxo-dGTP pyrophosphatase MutT (NUDIX family)